MTMPPGYPSEFCPTTVARWSVTSCVCLELILTCCVKTSELPGWPDLKGLLHWQPACTTDVTDPATAHIIPVIARLMQNTLVIEENVLRGKNTRNLSGEKSLTGLIAT